MVHKKQTLVMVYEAIDWIGPRLTFTAFFLKSATTAKATLIQQTIFVMSYQKKKGGKKEENPM